MFFFDKHVLQILFKNNSVYQLLSMLVPAQFMWMFLIWLKKHGFISGNTNVWITFPHVSNAIKQINIEGSILIWPLYCPPRPGGDIRIIANTIWEIISNNANPKKVATIDERIDLIFAGIPARSNELLK